MESPEFDVVALGRAISRRRQALGWARYRLAGRAGMADPYLGRVEAGDTKRVGVEVVAKLAKALGTTVDALLADAGLPTSSGQTSEMDRLYRALGPIERRALLRVGHTLRDLQAEYAAQQEGQPAEDEEPVQEEDDDIAAFPPDESEGLHGQGEDIEPA